MNCPQCDASSLSADGMEKIANCSQCRGEWTENRNGQALFRGNLIYLPFASHLSEEDERQEQVGKAA